MPERVIYSARVEVLTKENFDPAFDCGATILNDWFRHKSLPSDELSCSRTHVVIGKLEEVQKEFVLGCFSLRATTCYYQNDLAKHVNPITEITGERHIPAVEITWLARSLKARGYRCGDILLVNALETIHSASRTIGIKGVYLKTTGQGRVLYERYGFEDLGENYLFLGIEIIDQLVNRDSD